MANLYDINKEILDCVDLDTGEIIDIEKFDALQFDRAEKLEQIALWLKNLRADAAAYKAEKDNFADAHKRAEAKVKSLSDYLDQNLRGQKFSTTKVNITYRKSSTLEYDGTTDVPEQYLKYKDPEIDKAAIKDELKSGKEVSGFAIVDNNNIQIK